MKGVEALLDLSLFHPVHGLSPFHFSFSLWNGFLSMLSLSSHPFSLSLSPFLLDISETSLDILNGCSRYSTHCTIQIMALGHFPDILCLFMEVFSLFFSLSKKSTTTVLCYLKLLSVHHALPPPNRDRKD